MSNTGNADLALAKGFALSFARRLSLGRHIIDELIQEAAIGIIRARKSYKPARGGFAAYASLWARHFMRLHVNHLAGPVAHSEMVTDGIAYDAAKDDREERETAFDAAAFKEALSKVDPRTALMVERYMAGYFYDEIAADLGVSREFVRRRVVAFAADLAPAA